MSILILSGLPGSGKTHFSLEWVAEDPPNRLRVNYDDLRVELFGCKGTTYFSKPSKDVRNHEATIKRIALDRASDFLLANPVEHSIVVDNTNLTDRARAPWVELGRSLGIQIEQVDIDTPVHECVRRDRLRMGDDRVGRAVIERMALTTGWLDWEDRGIYHHDEFVVVDIDGTLSDPSHRLHHINKPGCCKLEDHLGAPELPCEPCAKLSGWKPRWDRFHAEVDKDTPKWAIVSLVVNLAAVYNVIVVSGRSPEHGCGIKTEDWLDKYLGGYYLHLFMRAAGDYKPDYEHKQEILDLLPKDRIAFVLDDRDQVVEMWRRNGLTCLQVAKGAF